MIKYISGFIYSVLYVLLCNMFAGCFLKEDKRRKIRKNIFLMMWIAALFFISDIFDAIIALKFIAVIAIDFLFLWGSFRCNSKKAMMVAILYQISCVVSDFLILCFIQNVVPDINANNVNDSVASFVGVFLSQTLVSLFIFWLNGARNGKESQLLTFTEWIKLICVPIFSIITITALLINFNSKMSAGQNNTILFLAVGLVIVNIFVFQLILDISSRTKETKEAELQLQKSQQQIEFFKQKRKQYEELRKKEHEFQNELVALLGMLQSKKYEELSMRLSSLCNHSAEQIKHFDTNNPVVNIILNKKYNEAVAKKILMVTEFNDLSGVTLNESDLSILLSNMLNNALEASEQCQKQRVIKVKLKHENGIFMIAVRNHFEKELKRDGDKYLSGKADASQHGFGIANIRQVVERSEGTLVIEHEDQIFSVVACFYDN